MAKLDLTKTVVNILKDNPDKSFTASELAKEVLKVKPQECLEKMERTNLENEDKLLTQLTCEISARRKRTIAVPSTGIETDENKYPIEYRYFGKNNLQQSDKMPKKNNSPEHDMYPLLCDYLSNEYLFPKRIDEKTSQSKKGTAGRNTWLHPDVVAFKYLSKSWIPVIDRCSTDNACNKVCFYSYEVKDEIATMSNIREMFFQTVSNSSWAHYSYLVVPEIKDAETLEELKILCERHCIGVIQLNLENPLESIIKIHALKKSCVDWDMINRLADTNNDFHEFIETINTSYTYSPEKLKKILNLKDFTKDG